MGNDPPMTLMSPGDPDPAHNMAKIRRPLAARDQDAHPPKIFLKIFSTSLVTCFTPSSAALPAC
jgi:hypothetical protein